MDELELQIYNGLKTKILNAIISGEHDQAMEIIGQTLELNSSDHELFYFKGLVYSEQKQYKEALYSYNMAIEQKPDFEKAYFKRGIIKNLLRDKKGAETDFNIVLKINPNHFECINELEKLKIISNDSEPIFSEFIDERNGDKYKTVKIGEQIWMTELLRINTVDKNGDFEFYNRPKSYDDRDDLKKKFGLYYTLGDINIHAVEHVYNSTNGHKNYFKILPQGWLGPNAYDFLTLYRNVGKEIGYNENEIIIPTRNLKEGKWEWAEKGNDKILKETTSEIQTKYGLFNVLNGHYKAPLDHFCTILSDNYYTSYFMMKDGIPDIAHGFTGSAYMGILCIKA